MTDLALRAFETPREADLGLRRIASEAGLSISVLPTGYVFAIEHRHERGRTMINLVEGSPHGGGIGRLYLRIRAPEAAIAEAVGTIDRTAIDSLVPVPASMRPRVMVASPPLTRLMA